MHALKARVENGRYVIDEPTDLPEGTEIELVPANEAGNVVFDHDDDMSNEERVYVHEQIIASIRERRAGGETFDANEVMAELRAGS